MLFGIKQRTGDFKPLRGAICSNCGKDGMQVATLFRYVYLHFIPFFPLPRKLVSHCYHCGQVLSEKDLKQQLSGAFAIQHIEHESIPIYHYAGIISVLCAVASTAYTEQLEAHRLNDYLAQPISGDIYVVEIDKNEVPGARRNMFSIWQIENADQDKVTFRAGNLVFPTPKQAETFGISEAQEEKASFTGSNFSVERTALLKSLKEQKIRNIIRQENLTIAQNSSKAPPHP